MKLVTYRTAEGQIRHGRLDGTDLHDLGEGDLSSVVAGGATDPTGTVVPVDSVRVLAPLPRPGKVLCVAANYQEHILEAGGDPVDKSRISPRIFLKPDTAVIGPDDPFDIPEISAAADWEAELAVVIGTPARGISEDDALDHVFGYAASNDISLRKLAIGHARDIEGWVGFFDWLEGKWADGSAPLGPWLVTADEIPDPQDLPISLTLNGQVRQQATTGGMIYTVRELVAFCSRLCTLNPGDVILTGTPSGVGSATGDFLSDGDELVVDLGPLGRLRTPVRGNSSPADPS
ncbi:fumarylacetoacetate hydrolase family protein [Aestuariimicrobium soli]|uniref:fumarylacetoacetate hydrolase family protein n=1 Tax=Aestuariimicrobium soli TaxID=2035834 RepID=UPI003EB6B217